MSNIDKSMRETKVLAVTEISVRIVGVAHVTI